MNSNSGLTWFQARQQCISRGGDLLNVDTLDFFTAIQKQVDNSFSAPVDTRWWIGGSNEHWNWTDGNQNCLYYRKGRAYSFFYSIDII